ncbi:Bifunctional PGK/TIM [archaeon HR01]|nr:Bifunctional PGK/TIM [archaeon HR01]
MVDFLSIDDLELAGKKVFVRVDINTPVDPSSGRLMDLGRIREASVTIRALSKSAVVVGSHQGRVGRSDYISLKQHREALSKMLGTEVKFVEDVFGEAARNAIDRLNEGEVLMLENLRFAAEENYEYSFEDAAKTHLVSNLAPHLDACVLDAFPTAHRAHPSIVGFAEVLPTCAGLLVARELKALTRIIATSKAPYTAVLGGAKVSDRLEAINALISNGKADNVLLTGLIALVFLRAAKVLKASLDPELERYVPKAAELLSRYRENFHLPEDLAIMKDGERVEVDVRELGDAKPLDIGIKTIDKFSRIIKSSGTVYMSGPPGAFELKGFEKGTHELLMATATSLATTIVSGGHLTTSMETLGVKEWIDHVSTAGGALVMFLAGERLPLIEALKRAAARHKR